MVVHRGKTNVLPKSYCNNFFFSFIFINNTTPTARVYYTAPAAPLYTYSFLFHYSARFSFVPRSDFNLLLRF